MRAPALTALIGAAAALMAMNAQAALVSTDGGLGVYDTTNNVTWTSDANLMATQAASYSGGGAAFQVRFVLFGMNGGHFEMQAVLTRALPHHGDHELDMRFTARAAAGSDDQRDFLFNRGIQHQAQVAADGVFGNLEFVGQCRRHHGLASGQAGGDHVAAGEGEWRLHAVHLNRAQIRNQSCINKIFKRDAHTTSGPAGPEPTAWAAAGTG